MLITRLGTKAFLNSLTDPLSGLRLGDFVGGALTDVVRATGSEWQVSEGGTGVGKSLAYHAAAIPFVMERAAGGDKEPVVVSTRTKLLQDQLLHKDRRDSPLPSKENLADSFVILLHSIYSSIFVLANI